MPSWRRWSEWCPACWNLRACSKWACPSTSTCELVAASRCFSRRSGTTCTSCARASTTGKRRFGAKSTSSRWTSTATGSARTSSCSTRRSARGMCTAAPKALWGTWWLRLRLLPNSRTRRYVIDIGSNWWMPQGYVDVLDHLLSVKSTYFCIFCC